MSHEHTVVYLARLVLELRTPLSIGTGNPDGVFDTSLVRDANGLPAIPGSSLAGVLRHLWLASHAEDSADDLFGFQDRAEGGASRVSVSWGVVLDSRGEPVEGLLMGDQAQRLDDALLSRVLQQIDAPVYRNRVRLTHRGAAAPTGKFDRTVLPAGHRFALELRLWAREDDDGTQWRNLLDLFGHPGFRLGGATRAGLGSVRPVSIYQRRFDLRTPTEAVAFRVLGRGLTDSTGLDTHEPRCANDDWITGTLRLKANGLWRIGQGSQPLAPGAGKPADLLPVTEERIAWSDNTGKPVPHALLFPASSLKGALAHRMAFHAHRLAGTWAEDVGQVDDPERPPAVRRLLGDVKRSADAGADTSSSTAGSAGCLYLDDAFLPVDQVQIERLMHNAIDRFTGGVRNRMLFEEESIYGGEVAIPVAIDRRRLGNGPEADETRRAFSAAIRDLCEGRLGLGSRSTTGNGFFSGEVTGYLREWVNPETA